MQGLQQQQQQLAALVTVALPNDGAADISSTRADFESDAGTAPSSGAAAADSDRLAAIDSLHRTILYPPNALLVAHSSSFLSQALSQLLSDKSRSVRRSTATAYGSLCAVLCSNGRQNSVLSGNLVDRFISWALPLLRDVSSRNGSAELALEAVQEFLKSGDAASVERYVVSILKTCQELLEDERTPLNLLHQILGLLVLISLKFGHCFQPNFMDIVDLLLGWAFIPDLPESDRRTIMDGFLQFRNHWCSDVRFPLGLLSKFLGDMDVLLQDESLGTEQQLRRLLSLLSCFLTVLQVTASGMMELNLLDQVSEPLSGMVPRLLSCLSMVGKKFGWLKWMAECWRCLTLLAEILGEKFSGFYSVAFDILFQSVSLGKMPSHLMHGVLKTNMQLLSLQKLGLSVSSVEKILHFSSPLSQLRLHPNHLVVGSSAVTYIFLLRNECNEVVVQAMHSLTKELEQLKVLLGNAQKGNTDSVGNLQEVCDMDDELYTESELLALIKFDLGMLLGSVGVGTSENLLEQWDSADSRRERSMKLVSFIFDKFDLFEPPISGCVELQFHVLRMLHKLSEVELLAEFSMIKSSWKISSVEIDERQKIVVDYVKENEILITDYLRKYNACMVRALRISSPLTVKLEAMEWICTFCRAVKNIREIESISYYIEPCGHASIDVNLLFSVLDAASDREFKVRSHVGSVVELLMQAWLISPENFQSVALVALEKLGDPDFAIKNAFIKVLSIIVPFTFYVSGALVDQSWNISEYYGSRLGMTTHLNWKQLDAEHSEGNLNIGSSNARLLPMRLLLEFLEALKKHVYNAYEGSSIIPSATQQSSMFFRANKKVCEEWFSQDSQHTLSPSGSSRHFPWMTGLVFQARGQHEKAAAHFSHVLQSDEALSSMGSEGIQFTIARVIESYTMLSDWKSLEACLVELQALRAKHAGKVYSGALTAAGNEMNAIHALARFDEGDFEAAWGYLDLTPKSSSEVALDPKLSLERSELMLLRAMLQRNVKMDKMPDDIEKAKSMLEEALSVVPLDGLTEAGGYATQLHCIFAFEEGHQSCSMSSDLLPELTPARFHLTNDEISRVKAVITKLFLHDTVVIDAGDIQQTDGSDVRLYSTGVAPVSSIVQQAINFIEAAAGASGTENVNGDCPSVVLSSQLQMAIHQANPEIEICDILPSIKELIDIWWSLRQRRVTLFGHAAHGYFQFLSQYSSKLHESQLGMHHPDFMKQRSGSWTLRSILYILHILLNYGEELRETLEKGLATVPLLPWQEIVPQLFARLTSHPKQVVRKQLQGEAAEELHQILSCMEKLYPKLVQDVQLMINELGKITVLWEEQWLSTLQDLRTDVIRRISLLKEEAARVAENATLSHSEKSKINAAKYSAMMAPIIVALERRLASTSREPETDHERWFQKDYGEQLKSALSTFKTPPASAAALGDIWRPFDAVAASIATYQRKSNISLSEVAPRLALLTSSDVPVPGLEKKINTLNSTEFTEAGLQDIITISSFGEQVTILSTKTRPKKLVILGSDGQKYTYLLKGREDLRLDARIMQLLQAINSFIHSDTQTNSQSLAIRYYSVTPISGRAGLIQWVDNVMSIYSVFKAWQYRVHLAQLATTGVDSVHQTVPPVPRPSDMFYGKIIPALKEKGIRRVISRRDWPHEVKRKVLVELMKETPRHLLRQELWCASEGFKAFSLKSKRFSASVAAMSIVGHILGLGDRHLDNILMDFCSGDVVHIDYNVCFDKGRRLKIPEIVPFRLTQTIETALGMTGTEEWTRGDGHDEAAIGGEEKKGMELAVSLSLFASRVQEIRVPLQEHHDLLLATLPATETALEKFSDVLNQYEAVSSTFYHADQEMSSLLLHEKSAKSILAEASSNMEKTRATFEVQALEFAQAKAMAAEKAQDLTVWMEHHGRVLDALRSGSVPEVQACIRLSSLGEALSVTSAVLVAGVPLTVVPEPTQVQCHDLDREISQLATDLDNGLSFAIKALQEYSFALQRILPLNYIASSPVHGWAQILQLSLNNLSSDFLTLARRQAVDLFAKSQGDGVDSVKQRHEVLCFKVEKYEMEMEKIEREYAELVNSINSENEVIFKDRLLSAFTKYMHSAGISRKEDVAVAMQSAYHKHDVPRKEHGDLEERKSKVVLVLRSAANALYNEVKMKVFDLSRKSAVRIDSHENDNSHPNLGVICEFEEQVEKCVLIAGFVSEVQQLIDMDLPSISKESDIIKFSIEENWAVIFKASVHECKMLIEQMIEVVLPEIIKSVVSYNSEVMEAFGSLSQIRGSIDTALEQLVEVELEKASLMDLEQNYFANVELIKEKQQFLKEAAAKGRDHLSWEEAEELASQEEVCRAQLDKLNQTWNQKDMLISSLTKREATLRNSLGSTERLFSTLTGTEQGGDLQTVRSKALLATLVKPFARLESLDQILPPHGSFSYHPNWSSVKVADILNSGYSFSESIWKFANLLKEHSLFIWKIGVMDSFLDSCMHDISSSVDHNLGFEQIYNILKKKLEYLLQEHVIRYLRERIAPSLLVHLARENEQHKQLSETVESVSDQAKRDAGAAKRVQLMLEEYCNAHETAMAARTTASLMKKRVNELTEALQKTILEIVQMEWMNDLSLPYLHKIKIAQQRLFGDDKSSLMILNLNRSKLLENIQSAMTSISRSDECLQTCERTSVSVEGQLERAMGWACAGPNTTGTPGNATVKNSGIPSEFHDHLLRRRQLLWTAREQSFNVIKVCTTVMEFEASRDGLFRMPSEISPSRTTAEGRTWQQAYSSVLTRLDVSHHSFTRAEQELKVAQSCMEAAAKGLYSATTELSHASIKANVALSAFSRVSKGHTALTSECGSMLEEVLAITDGLHDVSSLGKEAAALHGALMVNLSKALEGLGGSQVVRSQEIDISRSGLEAEEGVGFDDGEKDAFPGSRESYIEEVGVVDQLTSQDEGWISPPSDIFSSSPESSITSETSLSGNNGIHADTAAEQYLSTDDAIGVRDGSISDSLVETSNLESADAQNTQPQQTVVETTNPREHFQILSSPEDSQTSHSDSSHMTRNRMSETYPLGGGNEASTSDQDNGQGGSREDPPTCVTSASRVTKGKNAYALSVLRQVEMKLDGRDIDGDSEFARLHEKARTALGGGEPSGSEPQPPKAPPLGIAGLNQAMRAKPKSSSVPYSETVVSLLVECFSP
ncbi:Serine/threonine-protein kinase TOR [Acorus calamus]|uniref:Serine/threonine-protein kinase TOR n=1 Tax=Acorus calamus TaxID=4465 RepID=A0AAV9DGV1_ACOCL|nr:Serine/threonine-protein kinase TOR [Acorus calamus]